MSLNTKQKGNIALAHALAYFGEKGYYLFLPVGDNGRSIDLAISEDGMNLQRVQCKYTQQRHTEMLRKSPDHPVWEVSLRQTGRHTGESGRVLAELIYDETSFDILFISTPEGDYLIDWRILCQELGRVPSVLRLGKRAEKYRL